MLSSSQFGVAAYGPDQPTIDYSTIDMVGIFTVDRNIIDFGGFVIFRVLPYFSFRLSFCRISPLFACGGSLQKPDLQFFISTSLPIKGRWSRDQ